MKTKNFSFEIPPELIAQKPSLKRGGSRLMILDRATGSIEDATMRSFPSWVEPGSLVVFNDTRVRNARIYGIVEATGATVEFLLLAKRSPDLWSVLTKKLKKQREGTTYRFPENVIGSIQGTEEGSKLIRFKPPIDEEYLSRHGDVPLPPYIKRKPSKLDERRYQTVYARQTGSSAAPTAGLHFTDEIMEDMKKRGVMIAFLTLNVGTATFLPIRTENVEQHKMSEEEFFISDETAGLVNEAMNENRDIIAVGTTVVRALESSYSGGRIESGKQHTELFITPGFRFKVVSRLFTNFHTPRSSLIVLVSAFAGRELTGMAYDRAVQSRYRFFSYGDAMLIL
jgi:S-adenosylmethionine:tRNA ribosyltransferase-isomerase